MLSNCDSSLRPFVLMWVSNNVNNFVIIVYKKKKKKIELVLYTLVLGVLILSLIICIFWFIIIIMYILTSCFSMSSLRIAVVSMTIRPSSVMSLGMVLDTFILSFTCMSTLAVSCWRLMTEMSSLTIGRYSSTNALTLTFKKEIWVSKHFK